MRLTLLKPKVHLGVTVNNQQILKCITKNYEDINQKLTRQKQNKGISIKQ